MIKLSTQCSKVYACYAWKQWEIWLQNCKMDTKTMQCMWILNKNDTWKKTGQTKIFIAISIDQETGSIDQKSGKIIFLKKQSILMQKLLKAHCIMNKMHEYEMKSFSKTLEFNPDLPKSRFSINLSSKHKH